MRKKKRSLDVLFEKGRSFCGVVDPSNIVIRQVRKKFLLFLPEMQIFLPASLHLLHVCHSTGPVLPRVVRIGRVQAAIAAGAATAGTTSSEVLARLADVATFDILDFMTIGREDQERADLRLVKRPGLVHVIKRVVSRKDGSPDIEFEPRLPALVKLGEHFGLWKGAASRKSSWLTWPNV